MNRSNRFVPACIAALVMLAGCEDASIDRGLEVEVNAATKAAAERCATGVTPSAGQPIATVGGNRYGWFDFNEFSTLALDNSELRTADVGAVPEPLSVAVWSLIAITIGGLSWWRRHWCD